MPQTFTFHESAHDTDFYFCSVKNFTIYYFPSMVSPEITTAWLENQS